MRISHIYYLYYCNSVTPHLTTDKITEFTREHRQTDNIAGSRELAVVT